MICIIYDPWSLENLSFTVKCFVIVQIKMLVYSPINITSLIFIWSIFISSSSVLKMFKIKYSLFFNNKIYRLVTNRKWRSLFSILRKLKSQQWLQHDVKIKNILMWLQTASSHPHYGFPFSSVQFYCYQERILVAKDVFFLLLQRFVF